MPATRRRQMKPKPTALAKAVDLLALQDHSEAKLREKLRARGYDRGEVDAALDTLKARRYIDDGRVAARQFARMYGEKSLSVRQIVQKLRQRGFGDDSITGSIPEDSDERDRGVAIRLLAAKFRAAAADADRDRMRQYLYRRGFPYAVCNRAVKEFLDHDHDTSNDGQ